MKLQYFFNKKLFIIFAFPSIGGALGWYMDRQETERLTLFRDKSALYGRVLKEGEAPTWP